MGAIGVLKEMEESYFGVEFIIGPRAFLEFGEVNFYIRLRSEDIIHKGRDGLGIESNFGIVAELNKLHCR